MESLDEMTKTSSAKEGFFKHVFNMDEASKHDLANITQYSILAIIPIIIINKLMQYYIPETDDSKGSIELSIEVVIQVLFIFIGLLFIHRLITYVPTYSGTAYADLHITNIVLAVLIIILSLQTKLGDKVNVLVDRLMDYMDSGKKSDKKQKKKNSKNQSNENIQQQQQQQQSSDNGTPIAQLPSVPPPQSLAQQSNTDFNSMFQQQPTPMVNAASPADQNGYENFGPMAANEALCGGGFGSSNW